MHDISLASGTIEPQSVVAHNNSTFCSARLAEDDTRVLGVSGPAISRFAGALETLPDGTTLFPCTPRNAATLRMQLPWLRPIALGTATSFGFGDRMGLATSGHIQAMRITGAEALIAPIFAQQSVRENSRTGRTPQQVLDDAMWAVFAAGWRAPWGADADHVKQMNDLAPFVAAGYTFYTIDPSDHVDNAAQTDSLETLRAKVAELPWGQLHTRYEALHATYCGQPIDVGAFTIDFHETDLLRALVKYGRALVHTAAISQALAAQLGIAERVTFLGRQGSGEMARFYHALDVLVLPSRTLPNWKEQFGRVLIEAMACAVPVIGSTSGEIPHVIGDAGLLFPEGDVDALRACLRMLAADPAERARLGEAGRRRVLAHYTMRQIAERTLEVYKRLRKS